MNQETRRCQNCKQDFIIEPDDFSFYKKIDVPSPTRCPKCRMQRRMLWRNEWMLHKRKSDLSGEEIISQHPSGTSFPVYGVREFYLREKWKPPVLEYDPGRSFLEQFRELQLRTPRRGLLTDLQSLENGSEYQNASSRNKNCYLVFASGDDEDCYYGNDVDRCKTTVDSLWVRETEYAYECVDVLNSNHVFFSQELAECVRSWFLFDCRNCMDCFGCVGLRNKSYCLWNKQLSREKYIEETGKLLQNLTRTKIDEFSARLEQLRTEFPHKFAHIDAQSASTCTGDYIFRSDKVRSGFTVHNSQNVRYSGKLIGCKECWDVNDWGDPMELCYESITVGKGAYRVFFSSDCWPECRELQYCDSCANSHHCFGCIGLKDASYCVLNKSYSQEQYKKLTERIIEDMKQRGEYGEFLPSAFSPFPYNETIAQDHFPLTKEEVLGKGLYWREQETRDYKFTKRTEEIPDHIADTNDSIVDEIIACAHNGGCNEECMTAFKITREELRFYRQFDIPPPHFCFNCRRARRFNQRNPLKLWHRKCHCGGAVSENGTYKNKTAHPHGDKPCPNEFETSYAPERKEIVYCEECYQAEII